MSYEILSLVTSRGKQRFQEAVRNGYAIQVTHFCVGSQGHDPDSPITALTPDPGFDPSPNTSGDRIPPDAVISPLAVSSAEDDPYFATIWTCTLNKGVATGAISSLYLMAKVVYPVTHADYDNLFVYAMSYFPLTVKTDSESFSYRVGIQY